MKREKLKELLGESASQEVIDAIMAANGKDIESANSKAKSSSDALHARISELEAQNEELSKANDSKMTEQEKWQAQIDKANKAAADAIHELNTQSAISVFAKAGLSEDEYTPLLGTVVNGDRKKTVKAAEAIASIIGSKVEAAVEQSKKTELGGMKGPEGGEQHGAVTTKKDFLALPYKEQVELKEQNPDILKQLS